MKGRERVIWGAGEERVLRGTAEGPFGRNFSEDRELTARIVDACVTVGATFLGSFAPTVTIDEQALGWMIAVTGKLRAVGLGAIWVTPPEVGETVAVLGLTDLVEVVTTEEEAFALLEVGMLVGAAASGSSETRSAPLRAASAPRLPSEDRVSFRVEPCPVEGDARRFKLTHTLLGDTCRFAVELALVETPPGVEDQRVSFKLRRAKGERYERLALEVARVLGGGALVEADAPRTKLAGTAHLLDENRGTFHVLLDGDEDAAFFFHLDLDALRASFSAHPSADGARLVAKLLAFFQ